MNQCIPLLINTNAFINIMAKLLCPNSVSCLFVQEVARLLSQVKAVGIVSNTLKIAFERLKWIGASREQTQASAAKLADIIWKQQTGDKKKKEPRQNLRSTIIAALWRTPVVTEAVFLKQLSQLH